MTWAGNAIDRIAFFQLKHAWFFQTRVHPRCRSEVSCQGLPKNTKEERRGKHTICACLGTKGKERAARLYREKSHGRKEEQQ